MGIQRVGAVRGAPNRAGMWHCPTTSSGATSSRSNPARFRTDRRIMPSATCQERNNLRASVTPFMLHDSGAQHTGRGELEGD